MCYSGRKLLMPRTLYWPVSHPDVSGECLAKNKRKLYIVLTIMAIVKRVYNNSTTNIRNTT